MPTLASAHLSPNRSGSLPRAEHHPFNIVRSNFNADPPPFVCPLAQLQPLGVDGFIPNQHLGIPKGKKATDMYNVDDEVPANVIEFDKENKKIVLSVTDYFKKKEQSEFEEYLSSHGVAKTTLEEVARKTGDDKSTEAAVEEKPEKKKVPAKKKKAEKEEESEVEEKVKESKVKEPKTKETKAKEPKSEKVTAEEKAEEVKTEEVSEKEK